MIQDSGKSDEDWAQQQFVSQRKINGMWHSQNSISSICDVPHRRLLFSFWYLRFLFPFSGRFWCSDNAIDTFCIFPRWRVFSNVIITNCSHLFTCHLNEKTMFVPFKRTKCLIVINFNPNSKFLVNCIFLGLCLAINDINWNDFVAPWNTQKQQMNNGTLFQSSALQMAMQQMETKSMRKGKKKPKNIFKIIKLLSCC